MDSFSIVFVCTGNRFRSPLAEAFVRRLTLGLPVEVTSFGTLDLGSVPAFAEAHQIGRWCGVDLSGHRTRHLSAHSLSDVDLLLGFEEGHVRRAVVDADAPVDRAFLFREIVSLLEDERPSPQDDYAEHARAAVRAAAERRAALGEDAAVEEIPDPLGASWNTFTSLGTEIRELSIALVEALFGPRDKRGLPPLPDKLPRPKGSSWRV